MESKTQITISGEIESIGEIKSFSNGKFRKQEVVVKSGDGKYPNYYPCTFKNDAINMIDGWDKGDAVVVTGYVNGNKWDKKDEQGKIVRTMFFLEIDAKSIVTAAAAQDDSEQDEPLPEDSGEVAEDIPF